MVDVMGRKFKPLHAGETEEWEIAYGSTYDLQDEYAFCETCDKEVEIETGLRADGLANYCMECGTMLE